MFQSEDNKTRIKGEINGLTPGKHGIHINELGDLSEGCKSTKDHFNPFRKPHAGPTEKERHIGDLGNIIANDEGVAIIDLLDELVQLS